MGTAVGAADGQGTQPEFSGLAKVGLVAPARRCGRRAACAARSYPDVLEFASAAWFVLLFLRVQARRS